MFLRSRRLTFLLWLGIQLGDPRVKFAIDLIRVAFTFFFVQYKPIPTPNSANSANSGTETRPQPKRIIRVRLDSLPKLGLSNIPIVGNIDQPLDSISHLYIQDPEGTT
jgi:hypothetical protein